MERTIENKASVTDKSEGEIQLSVVSQPDGVVVNLGKPVGWFGMRPQEAVNFAALIMHHASEVAARTGVELTLTLPAAIALNGDVALPGEKPL
jgi:hypothetical protein